MPDDTLHVIGSLDGITAVSEIAGTLTAIGGDCNRCAVRDANCCALAECPFLKVCPVFKTITGNRLHERVAG
jgi:hypothetical protein